MKRCGCQFVSQPLCPCTAHPDPAARHSWCAPLAVPLLHISQAVPLVGQRQQALGQHLRDEECFAYLGQCSVEQLQRARWLCLRLQLHTTQLAVLATQLPICAPCMTTANKAEPTKAKQHKQRRTSREVTITDSSPFSVRLMPPRTPTMSPLRAGEPWGSLQARSAQVGMSLLSWLLVAASQQAVPAASGKPKGQQITI